MKEIKSPLVREEKCFFTRIHLLWTNLQTKENLENLNWLLKKAKVEKHYKNVYIFFQTLCLVLGLSLAQEETAEGSPAIRRLRLRRPRPVGISNPDGIAEGRPIPLRRIPQGKVNI